MKTNIKNSARVLNLGRRVILLFILLVFCRMISFSQAPTLVLSGLCDKNAIESFSTIGNPSVPTLSSSLPSTIFSNQNLEIVGDIIADESISFNNCLLRFSNGKSIFVNKDKVLDIKYSELFSCDKLWKGIVLDNEARVDLFGSYIEDAHTVILTNEKSVVNMVAVLMNKNYFGIRNNNSKSPVFGNFAFNRFTCSSELRSTWDKFGYSSGVWSYAGMQFKGCTVTIGSPAQPFMFPTYSIFDNMNNGIIGLDECILSVRNCRFDTLRHTGLVALNSHLDFEGIQIETDLESTVTRCGKYGIRAENSQLSVHKT